MPQDSSPENVFGARRKRTPRSPPPIPDHELLRCIGQGAYGEVWLARNVMGTFRAVKILYRDDFETARPYERELEGIRKFEPISRSHENLVDILQVGHNEPAGYFYYVMELADDAVADDVRRRTELASSTTTSTSPDHLLTSAATYESKTLKNELNRLGHLPFSECLRLGLALTSALEHLHERGLIHRDIKPSNIIFVNGILKLADIGLVTGFDETVSLVGTEGFIPPEGAGTVQADLYSLGKVLYEISTGKDRRHFPEPATSLGEFPDRKQLLELNEIIQKACQKDPSQRYLSAVQMRADLVVLESGESLRGLHRTQRRLARLTRVGAVAALVLVLVTAAYLYQRGQTRRFKQVTDESRQRLMRLNVANGMRLLDEGDYLGSLPWFTEALKLEQGPDREIIHRYRIEAVLRQCPKLVSLGFHAGPINSALFSPDGLRLVTASDDHTARLWNTQTGEPLGQPLTHDAPVNKAEFSPDGSKVVTASEDGTACVWQAATGKLAFPPLRHSAIVLQASFSPDGERIVTASEDHTARVWNASTGQPICPPLAHMEVVNSATFSPDGRLVLTASDDCTARLWNADTGEPVSPPMAQSDHVRWAAFSPDGLRVVTASRDRTAQVWRVHSGQPLTPPLKHSVPLWYAEFSPDGDRLVACGGGEAGEVRVWDSHNGTPIGKPLAYSAKVKCAVFTPDGRWLATASHDQTVRLWDASSGEPIGPILRHGNMIWTAAFSREGHQILTAGREGVWRLWDLSQIDGLNTLSDGQTLMCAEFSPDGKLLVALSQTETMVFWNLARSAMTETPIDYGGRVFMASFSPNGRSVVGACDRGIHVWDASTGRLACPPMQHESNFGFAIFSPDNRLVASVGDDGTARLWNTATGALWTAPLQHRLSVRFAAFSPDGKLLVTCTEMDTSGHSDVRVWSVATGKPVTPALPHMGARPPAAFSPDGKRLVTSCPLGGPGGGDAHVWDALTGRQIASSMKHSDGVNGVAFSPDGRDVATSCVDGTARIWDATTGTPRTGILKHESLVESVCFSPDGLRLVTTCRAAGTAHFWDALTGEPLGPPLRHGAGVTEVRFSPDGQSVITMALTTTAAIGLTRLWNLPANQHPPNHLQNLAALMATAQTDAAGGLTPLSPEQLRAISESLKKVMPSTTSSASSQTAVWHRRQAGDSERTKQWFAASFHLDRLLAATPNDETLLKRRARAGAEMSRMKEQAAKTSEP